MAIYEITATGLHPLSETRFDTEGLKERTDLQRLIRDKIDLLGSGLMVIAEEFGEWMDSSRRIDLLCLDREAKLVIVELKRTQDGGHMELQAIRYAAMVSAMTFTQMVDIHARFLDRSAPDLTASRKAILDFLGWDEPDEESFCTDVRIILASADFSKEITTSVMWLIDHGIEIKCVRLRPYKINDNRLLLDVQQIVPLPEAADFQTQIGIKKQAERSQNNQRHELRLKWWSALLEIARTRTTLHAGLSTTKDNWLATSAGRSGFKYIYTSRENDSQAELWIGLGQGMDAKNMHAFNSLKAEKDVIEDEFGAKLEWQDLPEKVGCRIRFIIDGGYRSPTENWIFIHESMIDAMIRLNKVFSKRIQNIRL